MALIMVRSKSTFKVPIEHEGECEFIEGEIYSVLTELPGRVNDVLIKDNNGRATYYPRINFSEDFEVTIV